jgi:hypothetical protein
MFTDEDSASILSDFPKFELSYGIMTHKKVFNHNIILAIPEGIKCFAWFTSYKNDNVCFIMEIHENRQIKNIRIGLAGFHDKLTLGEHGTVLYGTMYTWNGCSCFSIEDLYFYKGINYSNGTFISRLKLLKTILHNEISQNILTKNVVMFGLPVMNADLLPLLQEIDNLPYKISTLQYRWFETKKIMCANYFKPSQRTFLVPRPDTTNKPRESTTDARQITDARQTIETKQPNICKNQPQQLTNVNVRKIKQLSYAVFKITPDIQSDIYNLFSYKNGKHEFYDYAFIPDYETSVLMNKLFRNIKENQNLDALEESDDEDEFQDDRIDKYVYLDKSFNMNCQFNYKFKKWIPISIANVKESVVDYNLLAVKI